MLVGKAAEKRTAQICLDSACHLFCPATTTVGIAHCRVTQYEECIGALQTGLPQAEREKDGRERKREEINDQQSRMSQGNRIHSLGLSKTRVKPMLPSYCKQTAANVCSRRSTQECLRLEAGKN